MLKTQRQEDNEGKVSLSDRPFKKKEKKRKKQGVRRVGEERGENIGKRWRGDRKKGGGENKDGTKEERRNIISIIKK